MNLPVASSLFITTWIVLDLDNTSIRVTKGSSIRGQHPRIYQRCLSYDRVKVQSGNSDGDSWEIRVTHEGNNGRGEEFVEELVPHVRPIETIWGYNKPCCEQCTGVGSETLCRLPVPAHYYNASVNSARESINASLSLLRRNSNRRIKERGRERETGSRDGEWFLYVGDNREEEIIEKDRKGTKATSSTNGTRCRKFPRLDCMHPVRKIKRYSTYGTTMFCARNGTPWNVIWMLQ